VTVVYWITAAAALIGVWLNIRMCVACFWIWSVTNAVWVYADYTHGLLPQACLQLVYFGLAIYGVHAWSTRRDESGTRERKPETKDVCEAAK